MYFMSFMYFSDYSLDQHFSDFVLGTDGKTVNITEDIIGQFIEKHCKALLGKPKVFILSAIGGISLISKILIYHYTMAFQNIQNIFYCFCLVNYQVNKLI